VLIKAATALGALGIVAALCVALLILPTTLASAGPQWVGTLLIGEYESMAIAAMIAAVPLGLAFGVMPARNVAAKAVAVSACAAVLLVAFVAAFVGVRPRTWMPFLVEGVVFVALFTCCALLSHRLSSRFSRGATATLGAVAFVALFGLLVIWPVYAAMSRLPTTPESRLEHALGQIHEARSDTDKFYALRDAAKQSFIAGQIDEARNFASELLRLAPQFVRDWNYGNAIHDGNMVLGRIAVQEGRMDEAKQFLLKAGATPGSPQLNSFGPNMSLARDLFEKGEHEVVLQYFELVRKFWELENGRLNHWAEQVRIDKVPEFGPNLFY
jgi:hypothetical protein